MTNVLDAIKIRSSIRKFKDTPIEEEKLSCLIDAGLMAPTATNRQEVFITAVPCGHPVLEELQKELSGGKETANNWYYSAPTVLVLAAEKGFRFSDVDAGIAVENIALAAEGLGLGSVILGCIWKCFEGENADHYREALKMPEGYDYAIAIAVGYKDTEKEQHSFDASVKSVRL